MEKSPNCSHTSDPECQADKGIDYRSLLSYGLNWCHDSDPQCKIDSQSKLELPRKIRVCPNVPHVTDSESWKNFKKEISRETNCILANPN